jgi:uncharacterized C2H2 Zn-finger protein
MKYRLATLPSSNDDGMLACPNCPQMFKNQIAMRRHLSVYHSSDIKHRCDECGKVLSSKQNLTEHLNIHTGTKPFKCNFPGCIMSFRQGSQLSVHKRIHKAIMVYQSLPSEPQALKLTDLIKDTKHFECSVSGGVICGWEILPKITVPTATTCLPAFSSASLI